MADSPNTPKTEIFAKHLSALLYVGAAKADATPEQNEQLTQIRNLLMSFRENGNWEPIVRHVRKVMGPEWMPRDAFMKQLLAVRPDIREALAAVDSQ